MKTKKKYTSPKIKTTKLIAYASNSRGRDSFDLLMGSMSSEVYASSCCCTGLCFLKDTEITTFSGEKVKIQNLKKGIRVVSIDVANKKLSAEKIVETIECVREGHVIINGHIRCTLEHHLWVNDSVWKPANSIGLGDFLLDSSGNHVTVTKLEQKTGSQTVYNIKTSGPNHTYIAEGIVSHNPVKNGILAMDAS